MRKLESAFLQLWLNARQLPTRQISNILIYDERPGTRDIIWNALCFSIADNFYDLSLLQSIEKLGGYSKAFEKVRQALPISTKIRSGDLAEALAAEYVTQFTDYTVPIRKLRYKDDRDMAMRGDDVVAIGNLASYPPRLLKGEAKSREKLTSTVVNEACEALTRHQGRPNPSTLAFIARRLDERNEDTLATIFHRLQEEPPANRNITHLVFTLSANDPLTALTGQQHAPSPSITRQVVSLVVADHQDFIRQIFESI